MKRNQEFRVYGSEDKLKVVEANDILEAIGKRWNINITYAVIIGDLCIGSGNDNIHGESEVCTIERDLVISRSNFDKDVDFRRAIFDGYVSFGGSTFKGYTVFAGGIFGSRTCFVRTIFKRSADFSERYFGDYVDFSGATFEGNADFSDSSFKKGTDFNEACFSKNAWFGGTTFSGRIPISEAKTNAKNQTVTDIRRTPSLNKAKLDGLSPAAFDEIGYAYIGSSIPGAAFFFEQSGELYLARGKYSLAADRFRYAKVECERDGEYRKAGHIFIQEMDSTKRSLRTEEGSSIVKRAWFWIWKYTSNYGESPWRFIGCVAGIVLVFAIMYALSMLKLSWWPSWLSVEFRDYSYIKGNIFLTALYFSAVTFATLGFGDITPVNDLGKMLVIAEVLSGYLMFGVLITLVARKMTRS